MINKIIYFRFCSRKKRNICEDSLGSNDDIYRDLRKSKTPLYDELSIPFIDASLPPTPKVGRSSNPLDILLGKIEGSKSSLNGNVLNVPLICLSVSLYISRLSVWELEDFL